MINYNGTNDMFGDMTNYDIFMLKKSKKKAEGKLFDRKIESTEDISYEKYRNKAVRVEKSNNSFDYKSYLMEQLDRSSPEPILTEEEFYGKGNIKASPKPINSQTVPKKTRSNPSIASRISQKLFGNVELKKGSKIFIAFYVLIVLAVASILIVTNTASPFDNHHSVDAVGTNYAQTETSVKPMVVDESREEESNWFDKLCDSLKK